MWMSTSKTIIIKQNIKITLFVLGPLRECRSIRSGRFQAAASSTSGRRQVSSTPLVLPRRRAPVCLPRSSRMPCQPACPEVDEFWSVQTHLQPRVSWARPWFLTWSPQDGPGRVITQRMRVHMFVCKLVCVYAASGQPRSCLCQLTLVNFCLVLISNINHILHLLKPVLLPVSGMSKT